MPLASPIWSFEFFPPKGEKGAARLAKTLDALAPLSPDYVSVTCGAGGSTAAAEGTIATIREARGRGLTACAHVTCAGVPPKELDALIDRYRADAVSRFVALRGDAEPISGGFAGAADLVRALRPWREARLAVAAYPETHPKAASAVADLDYLKAKQDAGADFAITQYCFDTDRVLRFRDDARRAGVTLPIHVGVMPVHDFAQIKRFSEGCGAGVPPWLEARAAEDPAAVAIEQVERLRAEGFEHFHLYTLNRAELSAAIVERFRRPSLARVA